MSSINTAQARITAAFQATTWWQTQAAPGDFASGTASTSWTPVATALTAATGDTGSVPARSTALYAQLVSLIRQNVEQARRSGALSPTQRQDSLAYGTALLAAYEPSSRPGALTV